MRAELRETSGQLTFSHANLPETVIQGAVSWVRYRLTSGILRTASPANQSCSIDEQRFTDVHGAGNQRILHWTSNPDGIELTYRIRFYDQRSFLLLQLTVRNSGRESIYLEEMCLYQAIPSEGSMVQLSKGEDSLNFFRVGWHGWDFTSLRKPGQPNTDGRLGFLTDIAYTNLATPRSHRRGEYWSEGWGILADAQVAIVTGLTSTAHQFGQVSACTWPDEKKLSLMTQADGILLDPGESCDSEWGYLQFVQLPNSEPLADYVEAVARQMQVRVHQTAPPLMWTHWYQYYREIDEQLFLQNVDALAEQRAWVPFQVAELDDGYQSAWGDWTGTNERFPHGLEWLANQISARGFTPGLWLAPFAVQSKSRIAKEHPEWLVKDKHGKPARAGLIDSGFIQALDLTHPAVLEHLHKLVELLTRQWGYGMLKLDFINAAAQPGKRLNPKLTRAQALRQGLESIRQGAGEESFLLGSGCPFGPALGVLDSMRIGPDTAPSWKPTFHWIPWARPLFENEPSMPSLRNALRHTINLSCLNQRWWWNDPDCLLVREAVNKLSGTPGATRLTEAEVQTVITLVGLSGGVLVSSDDLRWLKPERLQWLARLVPNLGLRGNPLDLLTQEMPGIYQVKLRAIGQEWQDVALFNWQEHPSVCRVGFDQLGFEPGTRLHVFDFWSGRYFLMTTPEVVIDDMPPHGCKLLRVCEAGKLPQLVVDTLHISMGAEVESFGLEGNGLVIQTTDLGRQVDGELWLALPKQPLKTTCNHEPI